MRWKLHPQDFSVMSETPLLGTSWSTGWEGDNCPHWEAAINKWIHGSKEQPIIYWLHGRDGKAFLLCVNIGIGQYYVHVHRHIDEPACVYTCVCLNLHLCVHAHESGFVHVPESVCACAAQPACMCVYICTFMCTCTHTKS